MFICIYSYMYIDRYIQADVNEIHALTIHIHTYRYTWDTYIDNTYSYIGLLILFRLYFNKDWHANSPHGSLWQVYWDSKMKASPTSLSRVPIFPRSAATWLQFSVMKWLSESLSITSTHERRNVSYVYFYQYLAGGFKHVLFSIIYGMSSFPLTFIFFRGVGQPPTRYVFIHERPATFTFNMASMKVDRDALAITGHGESGTGPFKVTMFLDRECSGVYDPGPPAKLEWSDGEAKDPKVKFHLGNLMVKRRKSYH